jgi:hypothetical protein
MNKFTAGELVNYPRRNQYPSERKFFIVGYEKKGGTYVYHLAAYNFDILAFRTESHVPEDKLEKITKSRTKTTAP